MILVLLLFLFSTKTYVVGTQKNCLRGGILEHQKSMLKLMDKTIFTILNSKGLFILTS